LIARKKTVQVQNGQGVGVGFFPLWHATVRQRTVITGLCLEPNRQEPKTQEPTPTEGTE
jgi:hypothetical protein